MGRLIGGVGDTMRFFARLVLLSTTTLALTACNDYALGPGPPNLDRPVAVIDSSTTSYATLDTAMFDGTGSYDPDNSASDAIAEYRWSMRSRPPGSSTTAQPAGAGLASVFVDVAGTYELQLVVVDQDGLESEPEVFSFEGIPFEDIHVEVAWDIDISDVDVHLINETAGGQFFQAPFDCYYANMNPDWGPAGSFGNPTLDLDDVNGYGPENINVVSPEDGVSYRVVVHYYSDDGLGGTNATVKIYLSGELKYEQVQFLNQTGRTWEVARVSWPNGTIQELGNVYDYSPF